MASFARVVRSSDSASGTIVVGSLTDQDLDSLASLGALAAAALR
jgi:hypothetical protein